MKTQVCLFKTDKLTQVRTLLHLGNINSLVRLRDHSLYSFRLFLSDSSCARVFTPSLSLNCRSTAAFIRSPRQLLQSDTGDPHFALDPLTYRCLLSLSPAADFPEPRPPRHIYILNCLVNLIYIETNYKCNTFVFAPIFHKLNS